MPRIAVLDACVLYSFSTRDILLRLAEAGTFRPVWSDEILWELARSLDKSGVADGQRVQQLLRTHFTEALIPRGRRLPGGVPNEVQERDRHVVASAFAARADVIVTFNLKDFPARALKGVDLAVQHPDEFLMDQLATHADATTEAVRAQAAQLKNPPLSMEALALHLPNFARLVQEVVEQLE